MVSKQRILATDHTSHLEYTFIAQSSNILSQAPIHSVLLPRQDGGQQQSCSGVDGGGIAGIVIGTIVGTLLIVWIINSTRAKREDEDFLAEREAEKRRRRRRSSRRASSSYGGDRDTYSTSGGGGGGGTRTFVGDDGRTYRIREPTRVVYKS
jgi:hypothetical protein